MSITKLTRLLSFLSVKQTLDSRYEHILLILEECGYKTAQETADELYRRKIIDVPERNRAAPRLTELTQTGVTEVVGKKRCHKTGKMVAIYSIKERTVDDGQH